MSPELKRRLREVTQTVLADPQVIQNLVGRGFESKPLRGEEIDAYLAKEADKWADIVKRAGARVD
jgi:tripartite-type tricarboxylate transporter receptor subunit TctC